MGTYVKKCKRCGKLYTFGRSISDYCDVCKNYTLEACPATDEIKTILKSKVKFCPKCAEFYEYEKSLKEICNYCGTNLAETDFTNEQAWSMSGLQFAEWRNEHIINSPLYDKATADKQKDEFMRSRSMNSQTGIVHCPRCNSTQIQLVQRNWSFLTGFLTNKVDRVCVKCKHKF